MRRETTTVAVRRTRFEPPPANTLTVNPTSPTVSQALGQMMASLLQRTDTLEQKVDALATRTPQEATASATPPVPKTPVGAESQADTTALAKTPARRINRLRLRDIFD